MKVTIDIKETTRGDVSVELEVHRDKDNTVKEAFYAKAVMRVIEHALPIVCQLSGGQGAVKMPTRPENG